MNSFEVDIEQAPPMMKQFLSVKLKHQDSILLYRLGDFYECFMEDAVTISRELELTLTGRDGGALGKIPMAGIPAKAIDNYLPKLLDAGYKVAVCEQLEDPSMTKGLVKRDVVRVITAGTVVEDNLLKSNVNNYLAAVFEDKKTDKWGLSYVDISTGEFKVTQTNYAQIIAELARIKPVEIIAPSVAQSLLPFQIVREQRVDLPDEIVKNYNCSCVAANIFDEQRAKINITDALRIHSVDGLPFAQYKSGFCAAGAVLQYLINNQKESMPKIFGIDTYDLSEYVLMDSSTRRNLELLETVREKKKYGSLLWAIDKTKTNMGSRLLKKWIAQPLKDIKEISKRQDAVEFLVSEPQIRLSLAGLLDRVVDIQRLATRSSNGSISPRDFISLKNTLMLVPDFVEVLQNQQMDYFKVYDDVNAIVDFANIIDRTLIEDAPITIKDGGLIKSGVNAELDYFKDLLKNGKQWLEDFEEREKERTGIKTLKVGYSRVFGYFIEVTNSNLSQVPANYVRKQTLSGCERFITDELKKHEDDVLSASTKSAELEYKIFCDLREYSKEFIEAIREIAQNLAQIDVLLSYALCAIENQYVRPLVDGSNELCIKNGRHPVVEKILPLGQYVSNDLSLVGGDETYKSTEFMILTGPNMAGKSTFMRQQALIVLLAQIGSFVPAEYAKIGVVDKIFTRVGAVDDLSLGQSTFMVEMNETAYILNSATEKSLILLDEIGRGTSTYDGVAIAWSVAEYISQKIKARTIFATHYHELNVMPQSFPSIKNYRITISENDGEIVFLRKVVEGSASKSYGIQVAKMAGLPQSVVASAEKMMVKMQKDFSKDLSKGKSAKPSNTNAPQLSLLFGGKE